MSLTCIVPNSIWHAQQPLKFGPITLTTRMTIVRLRDGDLWVHSPISPTHELIEELQGIGTVRYVVAPNKSHHLFFLAFLNIYPSAQGFIAAGLESKRPDLSRFPHASPEAPWSAEIQGFFIEGLPVLNETAWFHGDTGTLILTDLLFCFSEANRGVAALVAKLLGVYGRLGMSRTMKLATKDKQALARSVLPLLSLPVQRVIVAHDQIINEQPMAKLSRAFAWLGRGLTPRSSGAPKAGLTWNGSPLFSTSEMQIEHRITVDASAETVFRIYEDVKNWHTWDPDTKQATLKGPFRVGSKGQITPPKGMTVPMVLTQMVPGRCFTVESRIPLFCMLFEHELLPSLGSTEVVHRVAFSGFLSFVLGPMLSKQLNSGLPVTLRNLKALAEARSAA